METRIFDMTELIIKNDTAKKSNAPKIRIVNRPDALSDEQLSGKLSGEVSDTFSCSDDDCREIVENHRPVFSNGLEKWL